MNRRQPVTLQAAPASDYYPDEYPDSVGDLPVEFAAQRELKVLLYISEVAPEILEGLDRKQMRDALRFLALKIYSGTFGKILENWDYVAEKFFPDDSDDEPESLQSEESAPDSMP